MNSDIYIFGKLGSYYSQCPDDFTSEIFMKMGEWDTSADTYISIHRKGELMSANWRLIVISDSVPFLMA